MTPEQKSKIEGLIKGKRIMLFMKGSPSLPQCGFSATVVGILKEHGAEFGSYNILHDQEVREGLKEYAQWPTYPQLWIDGKLVGGCDIVRDLHAKGQLAPMLKAPQG